MRIMTSSVCMSRLRGELVNNRVTLHELSLVTDLVLKTGVSVPMQLSGHTRTENAITLKFQRQKRLGSEDMLLDWK